MHSIVPRPWVLSRHLLCGLLIQVLFSSLLLAENNPDFASTTASRTEPTSAPWAITVSGQVTDDTGEGLPGVNIVVKETSRGAVTDIDGNYRIVAPLAESVLVFTFVGYLTQEIVVGNQQEINVELVSDVTSLDEVTVVGYGTQKKRDLTGSVVSLKSEDLTLGGTVSNVAQSLQGRAAGVMVTQNSKAPGGSMSVRIRGSNSISSTNEPLYVVDGFPTVNGADINPNDIASLEVLKDASATAIYGARAANGVILITTKRGEAGENKISYDGYVGVQRVRNPFDMLAGQQYMRLANDLYQEIEGQENIQNGVYTASQLQSEVNTDWIEETTRQGVVQNHNIQFKGGSEKTRVLTSLGYFDQQGVLKNTDFSRVSGRINIDQEVNDYVRAGASLFAQRENSNYKVYDGNILNSNVLYSILTYDPTVPVYNTDGSFGRPPGGKGDNPLANLVGRINDKQLDKLNGNMFVEIEPIEGLTARIRGGIETVHNAQGSYLPRSTYQGSIDNGVASVYQYTFNHQLLDGWITYAKTIGDIHSLNVLAGYSYEKRSSESQNVQVKDFSTDLFSFNNLGAASTITGVSSGKTENLLTSFFGRVNYSLMDKYLFTFTLRTDGSSRFGENNRWGTFPSGSFAWRLSDEAFIQDLGLFTDLKFRAGYGKTGNDQVGNYASYALISNTHVTFDGATNTAGTHLSQSTPENSSLKWETTSQYNAGFDMSFFEARLALTIDGYFKKTTDLLIRKNLPSYSGFTSGQSNVGSIENKGLEFDITSRNLVKELRWDTKLNFAFNRNKVLSLGGESDILITSSKPVGNVSEEQFAIVSEGEPLGSLYGYVYEGVIQEGEAYAPQPNAQPGDPRFADVNKDGAITSADRTIIGSANPDFIFGITNSFYYKNFDLSIFINGSQGNDLLNMSRMNLEWQRTTEALDRWTPENTNTDIPRNGFYYSQYGGYINSHFIEDASFVRLRNLTLGYTLPVNGKIVESCRLYFMAENLLTLTQYSGWDPEVDTKRYENDPLVKNSGNSQTANAGAGLDFNSYPSMQSFTFGLNVTF